MIALTNNFLTEMVPWYRD